MNNTQQLPAGWVMKPLGELGKWYGGGTPSKDNAAYWTEGTIPWVSPKDMRYLWVSDAEDHITEEAIANSATSLIPAGALLVVTRSGILRRLIPVAVNTVPVAINQDMKCLRLDQGHDLHYVLFCLRGFNQSLLQYAAKVGTTVESLEFSSLKSYRIPLPPLPEQRRIAAVLETWDEAIQTQTKLLATLRVQQRTLRQQLLTGAKRLSGFVDDWTEITISKVASEVSIRNKRDQVLEVLSCTKYHGLVRSLDFVSRQIFSENLTTYKVVPRHTFAYATNHIEEGSIGYQSEWDEALISPMYTVFKTDKSRVDDSFLFHLLKSERYIQIYQRNMSGSIDRRGGLRWTDFKRLPISIPPLPEQQAIAAVLNTAAEEIRLREDELKALREQKRGLMQQLLTGQLRVSDTSAQ